MPTEKIGVSLPEELVAAGKKRAKSEKISFSSLLCKSLAAYLGVDVKTPVWGRVSGLGGDLARFKSAVCAGIIFFFAHTLASAVSNGAGADFAVEEAAVQAASSAFAGEEIPSGRNIDAESVLLFHESHKQEEETRKAQKLYNIRGAALALKDWSRGYRDGDDVSEERAKEIIHLKGQSIGLTAYPNDPKWLKRMFGESSAVSVAKIILKHESSLAGEHARTARAILNPAPGDEEAAARSVKTANEIFFGSDESRYRSWYSAEEKERAALLADKREGFARALASGMSEEAVRAAGVLSLDALDSGARERLLSGLSAKDQADAASLAGAMRAQTDNAYAWDVLRELEVRALKNVCNEEFLAAFLQEKRWEKEIKKRQHQQRKKQEIARKILAKRELERKRIEMLRAQKESEELEKELGTLTDEELKLILESER